jgi:hypothetical protein
MSCYSHSEGDAAFAAPRTFSVRAILSRVTDHLRRAHERRRQRQELIDYLRSDHRAARDLGISIYEIDNRAAKRRRCQREGTATGRGS